MAEGHGDWEYGVWVVGGCERVEGVCAPKHIEKKIDMQIWRDMKTVKLTFGIIQLDLGGALGAQLHPQIHNVLYTGLWYLFYM